MIRGRVRNDARDAPAGRPFFGGCPANVGVGARTDHEATLSHADSVALEQYGFLPNDVDHVPIWLKVCDTDGLIERDLGMRGNKTVGLRHGDDDDLASKDHEGRRHELVVECGQYATYCHVDVVRSCRRLHFPDESPLAQCEPGRDVEVGFMSSVAVHGVCGLVVVVAGHQTGDTRQAARSITALSEMPHMGRYVMDFPLRWGCQHCVCLAPPERARHFRSSIF